ncbi:MAG: HNH endonuclease [Propionibacteriales bacterium]|nr:HNH endonuclease [Propionibacteriales bacterium]
MRGASRCPTCAARVESARPNRPTNVNLTWRERKRRALVVRMWRADHGDVCPGWQRPEHPATDLTADHAVAVGAGGEQSGYLQVLCRSCNSAKGART